MAPVDVTWADAGIAETAASAVIKAAIRTDQTVLADNGTLPLNEMTAGEV